MHRSKNLKLIVTILVCAALIGIAFWAITGLFYQTTRVDWKMYGTLITADGEIGDSVEFTVKGSVKDYKDEADRIMLDIAFPDTFRYREYSSDTGRISQSDLYMGIPYFYWNGVSYDVSTEASVIASYGLNTDEEYLIIYWLDNPYFLVASTDPDKDPAAILEYFDTFKDYFD